MNHAEKTDDGRRPLKVKREERQHVLTLLLVFASLVAVSGLIVLFAWLFSG